jgi:hypothetical protein
MRTDRHDEVMVAFHSFSNGPTNALHTFNNKSEDITITGF